MPQLPNPPQYNDRKTLQTINLNKFSSIKLYFEGYLNTAGAWGIALTPMLVVHLI